MRRFLYIMLAWVIALIGCDTEDNIGNDFENFFIKYYGDEGNQTGIDLIEVEDGFLLLGTSQRTAGDRQVLLVKTDELGNQLWWQTYGGMDDETPVDFELGAGNVVYIGANVSKTTDSDVLIIKVDAVSGSQLDRSRRSLVTRAASRSDYHSMQS